MKKILLALLVLFAGCQEYKPKTQHISVIVDLTDEDSYKPTYNEIASYIAKGHSSDGLFISLLYVCVTRYALSYEFELPIGETGFLSNEDTRRRKKRMLLSQFKDTLENTKRGLSPQSEIFRLVAEELNKLSMVNGTRNILVFSDLEEHSFFSVYKNQDVQKLLLQPELVVQQFANEVSLSDDLSGITVHIIYIPSLEEEKVFTAMIGVYRILLESRGAILITTRTKRVQFRP